MKKLQQFWNWLKGPKSDFPLFVIALILVNLVGINAFLRLDLTSARSYSLSKASREIMRTIEEPLSVKVFFSPNLPSPYNNVERYLKDLLVEYKGAANRNFSYDFFDMDVPANQKIGNSYGLSTVQIQEVKDNEVGVKSAWMGLAVVYSDRIEVLDNLTSSDGLEYRLTSTISKMIATTNALSGLSGKVQMTLYATAKLSEFGISGFDKLEKSVLDAYNHVNQKNMNKIDYQRVDPELASDVDALVAKYGIQRITWSENKEGTKTGAGVLGIVLEYQDKFRVIPLELMRGIFGGYGITGLDTLDQDISDSLQSLMSKSMQLGYVTGHGELDLEDDRAGAARLSGLVSDMYEFKTLDLSKDSIPANITTLVINGPKEKYADAELYKIDQFLMKGGSILFFLDPFNEVQNQGGSSYFGNQPQYIPIDTGLSKLLEKYGVSVGTNYVLDTNCYESQQKNLGKVPLYYVPILDKKGLNQKHPVSRNLGYVLFLKTGSVNITLPKDNTDRKAVSLASSSSESWIMSDKISLSPFSMTPPEADKMTAENLMVLLEGRFDSAFDSVPAGVDNSADTDGTEKTAKTEKSGSNTVVTENRLTKSLQPGKIIVAGTSTITGSSLIDESGQQPIALLVRNAIDYLSGNGDLNDMRTKGLGINTLNKSTPTAKAFAQICNTYGIPVLIVLIGLIAWRKRIRRRRRIETKYGLPESKKVAEKTDTEAKR